LFRAMRQSASVVLLLLAGFVVFEGLVCCQRRDAVALK